LILLENHIDFIEENEGKKIIEFLIDKRNEWTLICISNNTYLQQHADEVIYMSEGQIKS
jgi:ABC-type lipoprotein export system ATPase subunit